MKRSLSSLITDTNVREYEVKEININIIYESYYQARKIFDENKLEELRRDSEERLLAVVDKTKKTTRIQLNNQMQTLINEHNEYIIAIEKQYKETLATCSQHVPKTPHAFAKRKT